MPRSARRRSTPSSPAKLRETTLSPRQTRRSARTQSHEPETADIKILRHQPPVLEPVNEQDDAETGTVDEEPRAVAETIVPSANGADRRSVLDDSVQSFDEVRLEDLDQNSIANSLNDIDIDADRIIGLIRNSPTHKLVEELQDQSSRIAKRLANYAESLQTHSEPCGPYYMLPVASLSMLLSRRGLPATGAAIIFAKANLAHFISGLLRIQLDKIDNDADQHLHFLVTSEPFPQPFLIPTAHQQHGFPSPEEGFEQRTLLLGLSILTQLYIRTALLSFDTDGFDPHGLIQDIFADGDGNLRNIMLSDSDASSSDGFAKLMQRRMQDLSKYISTGRESAVDLLALREKFPWKAFLTQAAAWTVESAKHLNVALVKEGGASAVTHSLKESPKVDSPRRERPKRQSRASKEDRRLEEGTAFLRDLDEVLDAADEESQIEDGEIDYQGQEPHQERQEPAQNQVHTATSRNTRDTIPESPQAIAEPSAVLQVRTEEQILASDDHDHNPVADDEPPEHHVPDSAQLPPQPTQPTRETIDVLSIARRQEKESNKENSPPRQRYRLLDRQPDATRITFDEESQKAEHSGGKRPRRDSNDTEDDEFETDTRQTKRLRPHSGKAPVSTQPREDPAAMCFSGSEELGAERLYRSSSQPISRRIVPSNSRPGPSLTQPPPRSAATTFQSGAARAPHDQPRRRHSPSTSAQPPSSYEGYVDVKRQAQQNIRIASLVVTSSSTGPVSRSVQVRKAWDAMEIERLINLMEEYGTSWARIKQADEQLAMPLLTNRSQVQLKDKARNMKLDFLKAELPLPAYMENVTISKTHKDQLRRMNIAVPDDYRAEEAA